MYYLLGHISRYVRPNSVRIGMTLDRGNSNENDLWVLAVEQGDTEKTVLVVLNTNEQSGFKLTLSDPRYGNTVVYIEKHSIQTFIWK